MIMPASAIVPSNATKPNGTRKIARTSDTPIMPSGAVNRTSAIFFMFCNWIISRIRMAAIASGATAPIERWARMLDSVAPPTSMR